MRRPQARPESSLSQTVRIRSALLGAVGLSALLLSSGVGAQVFDFQPRLDTRLTYTDNASASSSGKKSAWVAEVSPGLAGGISREGARVSGRFNLGIRNLGYASDEGWRSPALSLQAAGEVEAIEDHFFVEMDAAVRRDNLSTFSGRASDDFLNNERSNETRTLTLAPRLEFGLGSIATGRIQYRQTWLSGGSNSLSGQKNGQWLASLDSARAFGPLGWGLSYSRSDNTYSDSDLDDVTQESLRATLLYSVSQQLRLRGSVGRESNDFGTGRSESYRIVGAGFDWFPTVRTAVSGTVEDRFFGNGYDLSFSHRMARSTFQLAAGRDVTSSLQRFGSVFQDPFFLLFFNDPVLVALLPDQFEREAFVRQLLGLTGDTFISNAYFVSRNLRATYAITGARNTLTFSITSNDRSSLGTLTGLRAEDVFRSADRVKTKAASISLSHRLTPRSSLNATLTRAVAESSAGLAQKTRRMTSSIGYSTSIGARSVAGLTYRHQRSDGSTAGSDFSENVLTANFGMRF